MNSVPFWTSEGTVDLAALRPENLTAEIIGSTLAKAARFGGRTSVPWSVASHSVLVEHLCPPEVRPWALLHDAHEAFIGDLMTPSVEFIALFSPVPGAVEDAITHAKGQLDRTIGAAWKVSVRSLNAALRQADRIACLAEASVFLGVEIDSRDASQKAMIDTALRLIPRLPSGAEWQDARDLWIDRTEHYARLGWMFPPQAAPQPTGMSPVA